MNSVRRQGPVGPGGSASSYSVLLSLLKYVESSNSSHISNAAISLSEEPPRDQEVAIKLTEHLVWFSFLLDGTLELLQPHKST